MQVPMHPLVHESEHVPVHPIHSFAQPEHPVPHADLHVIEHDEEQDSHDGVVANPFKVPSHVPVHPVH